MTGKPSQEYLVEQLRLHKEGDPVAQSRLAEAIYPTLVRFLGFKYKVNVDEDWIHEAAGEAVINFLKKPDGYDPRKKSLLSYLERAADWQIKDILKKYKTYHARFTSLESPKVLDIRQDVDVLDGYSVLEIKEEFERKKTSGVEPDLTEKISQLFNNEADVRIAELICAKVRSTVQYVAILGILDEPAEERNRIVKRHKDRIKLKMIRAGYKV
jgi:hypothetical protein